MTYDRLTFNKNLIHVFVPFGNFAGRRDCDDGQIAVLVGSFIEFTDSHVIFDDGVERRDRKRERALGIYDTVTT